MADKWNPKDLQDSRYIWLPVQFKNGKPYIEWKDEWDLNYLVSNNFHFLGSCLREPKSEVKVVRADTNHG